MRYKAIYKDDLCKLLNTNAPYVINMTKVKIPKHRAEIVQYFDTSLSDPKVNDNGDGTITLEFDPIPLEMATWMVQSKTVFFNVVRRNMGSCKSHWTDKDGESRVTKHYVRVTFPYKWNYSDNNNNTTIPNTTADRNNRRLQISELTSGSITRDISHVWDLSNHCSWNNAFYAYDLEAEFYVGLIYYDEDNTPAMYCMGHLSYPWSEHGQY